MSRAANIKMGVVYGLLGCFVLGSCSGAGTVKRGLVASPNTSAAVRIETYIVPGDDPRQDASLYAVDVHDGKQGSARLLGPSSQRHMSYPASASDASPPAVISYSSQDGKSILQQFTADDASYATTELSTDALPKTTLSAGGAAYVQEGAMVVAVRSGQKSNVRKLPDLAPDSVAGTFPTGYKGLYRGNGPGVVDAFGLESSGDVLAFESTGRAAAVTDVTTGRTAPLSGFSQLGPAVRGNDGDFFVLAWRLYDPTFTVKLLAVDPSTLAVTRTFDLLTTPSVLRGESLIPSSYRDIVVALASGNDAAKLDLSVWSLPDGKLQKAVGIPVGVGLSATSGDADDIYVFGGPGVNHVGRFDFADGAFTPDVPEYRTVSGSYVVGIAPY